MSRALQKHLDQVRQGTFSNMLSRRKTQMMNQYRQRAYGRQIDFAKMQQEFNADAASRAYVSEQIRFNEQMAEFAFNNVNFQKNLAEEMGKTAAGERYGKSAQRIAAVESLGQYGRNQAILAESLLSARADTQAAIRKIATDKFGADLAANASRMLKPERLPTPPKPLRTPRTEFLKPRKPTKYDFGPKPIKGATVSSTGSWMDAAGTILGAAASGIGQVW